jgi:hypothetical protein
MSNMYMGADNCGLMMKMQSCAAGIADEVVGDDSRIEGHTQTRISREPMSAYNDGRCQGIGIG